MDSQRWDGTERQNPSAAPKGHKGHFRAQPPSPAWAAWHGLRVGVHLETPVLMLMRGRAGKCERRKIYFKIKLYFPPIRVHMELVATAWQHHFLQHRQGDPPGPQSSKMSSLKETRAMTTVIEAAQVYRGKRWVKIPSGYLRNSLPENNTQLLKCCALLGKKAHNECPAMHSPVNVVKD